VIWPEKKYKPYAAGHATSKACIYISCNYLVQLIGKNIIVRNTAAGVRHLKQKKIINTNILNQKYLVSS
jgi:hypothetical protein